jgi:hypothetical protein
MITSQHDFSPNSFAGCISNVECSVGKIKIFLNWGLL